MSWKAQKAEDSSDYEIVSGSGHTIAAFVGHQEDAELMAAAPALLDVARLAHDFIAKNAPALMGQPGLDELWRSARAALRKAGGP